MTRSFIYCERCGGEDGDEVRCAICGKIGCSNCMSACPICSRSVCGDCYSGEVCRDCLYEICIQDYEETREK